MIRPTRSCATSALLTGVLSLVAACGGGGSSPNASPAPPPAASTAGLANAGCTLRYTADTEAPRTGTDPLLSSQWHLANDGRVTGLAGEDLRATVAWTTTRGDGVRVAVIDDAVEVTHDDLAPNVVAGASYDYRSASRGGVYPMPCTDSDSHGTAVAGIVSARDDDAIGGAGVAPRSALVGYNALASGTTADIADALNRDLDGNAIYNNSWGSSDDGFLHPAPTSFVTAIANGISRGRGGKGAIYVFPAGNGGCYAPDPQRPGQSCARENANYDGFTNQLGIIAACATDSDGRQPVYGERGANLLVCGPSSGVEPRSKIRTTGLADSDRSDFTGTSASTPMVSGVAALILAVNPNLTWRDVRLILAQTARRNDPTDSEWLPAGGTLAFNPKYGFGVANAQAAVAAARTWTSVGGSESMLGCGPYAVDVGRALPDPSGATTTPVTSAVDAAGCAIRQIEYITVKFTATHPSSGDLRLRLRSPTGLVSELADARFCYDASRRVVNCGNYENTHLGSVRHLGESVVAASGAQWTLEVTDMATSDTGSFVRWSIQFHGR
jgi:proprotein convertase subtilisin/kexin type 2